MRDDELIAGVEQTIAAAAEAWPDVRLSPGDFTAYVRERWPGRTDVAGLHGEDLVLAAACVNGQRKALETFDRVFLRALPAALASVGLDHDAVDDLLQTLRQRLLLPRAGQPPDLAGYAGRGRLSAWLRMVATREAIRARRRTQRAREDAVSTADASEARDAGSDPLVGQMRAQLREPLREAVAVGVQGLSERDRRLLQLSIIEGVDARTIATRLGVHESTISRWLKKAHAALRRATRGHLQQSLAVSRWELESLLRVFDGHFSMTTGTVWRMDGGP